jgi:hypothetical protein
LFASAERVNFLTLASWLFVFETLSKAEGPIMSQNQNSPITGILDESEVFLDFGKHEGRSVKELQFLDPDLYSTLAGEKGEGVFAIRRHRDKTFRLFLNPLAQMDQ